MATVSISTAIRITLMILFILALFGMGRLLDVYIAMRPDQVWPGWEAWRLVSYPLALNFGGLLIGAIAFSQPGEEIESMLGKSRFGITLLIVTLIASSLHLLLFLGQPGPPLAGPQNLSLFVMVGYVYLFPSSSVRVLFFNVRSKILLLLMALFVAGATGYGASHGESILVFFAEGGAGLIVGGIWFHLVYQKYPILLGPLRAISGIGKRAERKGSPSPSRIPRTPSRIRREEIDDVPRRSVSDEERLDAILEQISKKGYESISSEDRDFLDEYSSRL